MRKNCASKYNHDRERDRFSGERNNVAQKVLQGKDIRIEATSEHLETLVYSGGNGFLVALLTAFAQHLPLLLAPDHIWSLITYALAEHVDKNSEVLRSNFGAQEEKKRLLVVTPEASTPNGARASEWE